MDGQRLERMIRVAMVTALIMSAGTALYLCIIQGPPTWDGGDHSFHALRIHQALSRMDVTESSASGHGIRVHSILGGGMG